MSTQTRHARGSAAPWSVQAAAAATRKLKSLPSRGTQRINPAKKSAPPKNGTQRIGTVSTGKKLRAIEVFSKEKIFRNKVKNAAPPPKLLARVEQLRLLSKLEEAGLLSLLEKNGITLTFIEKSGLLSVAEDFGVLSAAADRKTPGAVFALAFALFALAPAAVYLIPDDNPGLIVAQVLAVAVGAFGGAAAYGVGTLLASLQKDI